MANYKINEDIAQSIIRAISEYTSEYNCSPSQREISEATGHSRTTVHKYLSVLDARGDINKPDGKIRAMTVNHPINPAHLRWLDGMRKRENNEPL